MSQSELAETPHAGQGQGGQERGQESRNPAGPGQQRGEVIAHPGGFELEVVDADPRRVKKVRVRSAVAPVPAPSAAKATEA